VRLLRSVVSLLLLAPSASAQWYDWAVTTQNKSQQLTPVSSTSIKVHNKGTASVVVKVYQEGELLSSTEVSAGSNTSIPVPIGAKAYVVHNGSDTHGQHANGT
jgi:hypothetical protein